LYSSLEKKSDLKKNNKNKKSEEDHCKRAQEHQSSSALVCKKLCSWEAAGSWFFQKLLLGDKKSKFERTSLYMKDPIARRGACSDEL